MQGTVNFAALRRNGADSLRMYLTRCAIDIGVHTGILQEMPGLDALLKLLLGGEVIVDAVLCRQARYDQCTATGASCTYMNGGSACRTYMAAHCFLTSSPCLGARVVWEQEKPNSRGEPSISFLMSVPLPTPDGPHTTRAEGRAAISALFCPSVCACPSSEEYAPPIPRPCHSPANQYTIASCGRVHYAGVSI